MSFPEHLPSNEWAPVTQAGATIAQVRYQPDREPFTLEFRVPRERFDVDDLAQLLTVEDLLTAVAVATERGLLTPVVREVDSVTITALAARVADLAERSRAGKLRQDELEGGSMSVTNLGMYGTEEFAAIINPPHAAILAVGAVKEEPVVEDGALAVGKVMRLTLSVDHRPVDGVIAARWMQALVDLLEHPVRILA